MTERTFGSNFKWFVAKVVNRGDGKQGDKDKTESGRVQIRIYGKHDDEKNIPDSALPWAIPMLPINSGPGREGVSGSPVGLKKDSQVVGFYADEDEEIPILMGVLLRSGKDSDASPDSQGEDVNASKSNDAPLGSRTAATAGTDHNDVIGNKSLVSNVAADGQHWPDKPTMGNLPFDGSSALDTMNRADPRNLSGSIPGALGAMKSMTSTLNVAGSLLSNFSGLVKAASNLNSLQKILGNMLVQGALSSGLKSYRPNPSLLSATNLAGFNSLGTNFSVAAAGANIASKLVQNAFSGGNPLESLVSGLGGAAGLIGLAGKSTAVLGPISGNFGAASAIASTLKGMGQSALSNLSPAPTAKLPSFIPNNLSATSLRELSSPLGGLTAGANFLQNSPLSALGLPANIAGAIPIRSLTSFGSQLLGTTISQSLSLAALNGSSIGLPLNNVLHNVNIETGIGNPYTRTPLDPASFNNSSIFLPTGLSLNNIRAVSNKNPSIPISVFNSSTPTITNSTTYNAYSSEIIPDVTFASATYDSSLGLNNSYISVTIPQGLTSYSIKQTLNRNPGINYNVHGSVFKVNKTSRTVRK